MKLKVDPVLGVMLAIMAVLFILIAYAFVRPEPLSKVLLKKSGCEAVARLGQKTIKLQEGCEVESVVIIGWNWVSVGDIKVEKNQVIAIREN